MNRTIKFRGKRVDGNGWAIGCLVEYWSPDSDKETHIVGWKGDHYSVDPSTVGQFTGLLDKDGKEIYEGDVISINKKASLYANCPITVIGVVVYVNGKYEVETKKVINKFYLDEHSIHFGISVMDWIHLPEFGRSELTGNIHDNPELLK